MSFTKERYFSVYDTNTVHSPLHDNKQTLPALIEVLIDINDAHNVGTGRSPPVQLHFPTGLGTILQHLDRRSETRRVRLVNIKYRNRSIVKYTASYHYRLIARLLHTTITGKRERDQHQLISGLVG